MPVRPAGRETARGSPVTGAGRSQRRERGSIGGVGVVNSLWRAVAVFRIGALGYAAYIVADGYSGYARPGLGLIVLAVMAAWTATTTWAYHGPSRRGWPLLLADFAVTAAALYASRFVIEPERLERGAQTLTALWVAAPVIALAVAKGRWPAAAAGVVLGFVDGFLRGFDSGVTLNSQVLLVLSGVVMGYLTNVATAAEQRLQRATEIEAANRERERLARSIHDSVLQALALIQRRGAELGGEAADLGRLAGEQGAVLRTLVGVSASPPPAAGDIDMRNLLSQYSSPLVSVAVPATPVPLPSAVATEVDAAVAAALANVAAHAGTDGRAVVFVEDEGDTVTVTVRDEGVGMAPGRLAEAEAAGRLGVAQSIRGRVRDVGGTVTIVTAPGAGTEVEMRVPRQASLVRGTA